LTDNLAEMGTAKQSRSYHGFNVKKALDGNRNQNWYGGSCGHTAIGHTEAWWRLDIGQPANIYNIVIYYRNHSKYKMLCVMLYSFPDTGIMHYVFGHMQEFDKYYLIIRSECFNIYII
jgi:hypothetical protein